MNVIERELTVAYDVDNTLLSWFDATVPSPEKIAIDFAGKKVYLTPHQYHIDLMRTYNERGYYIIVWSANGYRHAKRAVEALGLQEYVSGDNGHIQSKLSKWVDDNPNADSVLGPRVFEEDLTKQAKFFIPAGHKIIKV